MRKSFPNRNRNDTYKNDIMAFWSVPEFLGHLRNTKLQGCSSSNALEELGSLGVKYTIIVIKSPQNPIPIVKALHQVLRGILFIICIMSYEVRCFKKLRALA